MTTTAIAPTYAELMEALKEGREHNATLSRLLCDALARVGCLSAAIDSAIAFAEKVKEADVTFADSDAIIDHVAALFDAREEFGL